MQNSMSCTVVGLHLHTPTMYWAHKKFETERINFKLSESVHEYEYSLIMDHL
jgi:hypothetical protein